jgi:hypothetical protein
MNMKKMIIKIDWKKLNVDLNLKINKINLITAIIRITVTLNEFNF